MMPSHVWSVHREQAAVPCRASDLMKPGAGAELSTLSVCLFSLLFRETGIHWERLDVCVQRPTVEEEDVYSEQLNTG